MFLEELSELFGENWSKFLTAGYLVFWKHFLAAGYLDTSYQKTKNHLNKYCPYLDVQIFTEEHFNLDKQCKSAESKLVYAQREAPPLCD